MREICLDIEGTPEDVAAMIAVSHNVEASCFKKKRINAGHYQLWYRGDDNSPNDLIAALKRRAGLVKSKPARAEKPVDVVEESEDNAGSPE